MILNISFCSLLTVNPFILLVLLLLCCALLCLAMQCAAFPCVAFEPLSNPRYSLVKMSIRCCFALPCLALLCFALPCSAFEFYPAKHTQRMCLTRLLAFCDAMHCSALHCYALLCSALHLSFTPNLKSLLLPCHVSGENHQNRHNMQNALAVF